MNFGMIILNRSIKTKQNYMDTDSFVIHIKTEDFYKALLMMLKHGLTHQITTVKMIKVNKNKKNLFFLKTN